MPKPDTQSLASAPVALSPLPESKSVPTGQQQLRRLY